MLRADVVIIGAGLAGAATALGLSRRDYRVVVLDKTTFPRDKVCGEGLMPHGVAALDALGLGEALRATEPQPFFGIAYHCGGERAVGRFPGGPGLGVRRMRVDAAVVAALGAAPGVHLQLGAGATALRRVSGGWLVETPEGQVWARALVGADGLRSWTRRQLGLEGEASTSPRYGLRQHVELAPGACLPRLVEVYVLDGGVELYLTPVGPRELNVAALVGRDATRASRSDMDAGMKRWIESCPQVRELVDGARPTSKLSLTGPLRQRPTQIVTEGALLVGDAAGFIDALTGEGMSLGLLGARLAVETLDEAFQAGDLSEARLARYARRRAREARLMSALTEVIVRGVAYRPLAKRVLRQLRHHPRLFDEVLAVNVGAHQVPSLALPKGWRLPWRG